MAWNHAGGKPLPEPMMAKLPYTYMRPQPRYDKHQPLDIARPYKNSPCVALDNNRNMLDL